MAKITTKKMALGRVNMTYGQGSVRVASREETFLGLTAKLHEEAAEVILDPTNAEEYADVIQVLTDFARVNGVRPADIDKARVRKEKERGGFLTDEGRGLLWERFDD